MAEEWFLFPTNILFIYLMTILISLKMQHYHSEGLGKGSTFIVDFPIFQRKNALLEEKADDGDANLRMKPTLLVRRQSSVIRVLPIENSSNKDAPKSEESIDVETGYFPKQVLIVDDSAQNRFAQPKKSTFR